MKKEDVSKVGKIPSYLIITPDQTIVYGRRKMEHFNLRSMNSFLKAIQPEMNDFFLCSLLLANMFAVFYFLQVKFPPTCLFFMFKVKFNNLNVAKITQYKLRGGRRRMIQLMEPTSLYRSFLVVSLVYLVQFLDFPVILLHLFKGN